MSSSVPGAVGDHTDDLGLVRQVAAGSETALALLYDRHGSLVYRNALAMSRDRGVAEEVVQETFLALWNRAELFDPKLGSLTAWLLTIARNRAVDRIRAAGRRVPAVPFSTVMSDQPDEASATEWLVSAGEVLVAGAPEPAPDDVIAARERMVTVASALAVLDEVERLTILLAYRDGFTQSEIADHLGWPLGTVKTRSRRALHRLRGILADEAPVSMPRADVAPGSDSKPRSDPTPVLVEVGAPARTNDGHVPGDIECPRTSTSMTCPA